MAERIAGRSVRCDKRDTDRYGRIVAVCFAGGEELNSWLVSTGWAVAYRRYAMDYVAAEGAARAAHRGIWSGDFVMPWDWRRGERLTEGWEEVQGACRINGNISRSGERIYHVPGGRWYARTKIDEGKGERWFCCEAQARAAGWHPATEPE